ncbi:GMC oxidoreductase [Amylibacter sp.]|jgi:hypothetical protein|nr:GMC oxidoreductase [Amylibacter sp.]
MLKDFDDIKQNSIECDFLIVGGGTIGLTTSVQLAKKTHKDIICLEAGGFDFANSDSFFGKVEQKGSFYSGAEQGRFFCLGGTSTRWGGALIPFQKEDMSYADWDLNTFELYKFIPELENLFGLDSSSYDCEYISKEIDIDTNESYILRNAKWPSFKNRNVFTLFEKFIIQSKNLNVFYNSPVSNIIKNKEKVEITFGLNTKAKKTIITKNLIIAAGAIEVTRLALLLKNNNLDDFKVDVSNIGLGFSDHIALPVGEIKTNDLDKLNKFFAFQFLKKGTMKNLRFEMSGINNNRERIPPHYFHISFESNKKTGFVYLRNILRSVQMRKVPKAHDFFGIFLNLNWIFKLVWWRIVHSKLYRPAGSTATLNIVLEQTVSRKNKISLSELQIDQFGNPLPTIDWMITKNDKDTLFNACEHFEKFWIKKLDSQFGQLQLYNKNKLLKYCENNEGIYHPTGTTALNSKYNLASVDEKLNFIGFNNIQLISTSVLPSGGGANPTMMALLLALRCVYQHTK